MVDEATDARFEEIEASLRSEDWAVRSEAVKRASDLLKNIPSLPTVARVAEHFGRLAKDPKWDVRNAVAFALQFLNHTSFDQTLAKLLDDPNDYVRRTADKTLRRRRRLTRLAERREEEVESVLDKLNRLRNRYGPDLAREAVNFGRVYYEVVASTTAHDILNVLTALKQSLVTLRKELERRKVPKKAWLEDSEKAVRRCTTIEYIAGDMKRFADQSPPVYQKVNVLDLLNETIGMVQDRFFEDPDAAEITVDVNVVRHLMIDAPRVKLVQALTNIVKNAFEAIEGEGAVSVNAKLNESGELVLRVADTGCGIAPDDLREAFLPGSSTKKGKPGRSENTGMGLAIAQKIIESECRGQIRIESREGTGTLVTVVLPSEHEPDGGA